MKQVTICPHSLYKYTSNLLQEFLKSSKMGLAILLTTNLAKSSMLTKFVPYTVFNFYLAYKACMKTMC